MKSSSFSWKIEELAYEVSTGGIQKALEHRRGGAEAHPAAVLQGQPWSLYVWKRVLNNFNDLLHDASNVIRSYLCGPMQSTNCKSSVFHWSEAE